MAVASSPIPVEAPLDRSGCAANSHVAPEGDRESGPASIGREDNGVDDLVRRSREGDLEAFDVLVGRFYPATFRLAWRMLRDRDATDDAVQEIFIKAWRSLPRFRSGARFSTWLHAIAVNHCLDVGRRRARESTRTQRLSPPLDGEEDPSPGRLSPPAAWETGSNIRRAIERLPEKLGVPVTLHYLGGYSVEEVARALELHPNTVYARLKRALQRLKSDLDTEETR